MDIKDFCISTDMKKADAHLEISAKSKQQVIVKLSVKLPKKTVPDPVTVAWKVPVGNILSVWHPLAGFSRYIAPDWQRAKCESKTAVGAPVFALVNHNGTNACTIAVSDPKTPIEIGVGASEEESVFFCNAKFFTSYISPIDFYEAYIRIDFEELPFANAIGNVNRWWEERFGYRKAYVPKEAYLPMYSSWYNFHQALHPETLMEECRIAAKLGMKTIIIDDGWQTTDNNRGYCFCGDWELATEKIPSMKALTDEIHKLGMKVMLWYSVPFVGVHSKMYAKFKDMALAEENGVLTLDPRYREVRNYLVNTYEKGIRNFGLDGLKLDFIDRFKLTKESTAVNDRMDIPSVEDALEDLLRQTKETLVKINPEILLEFRQSYMGPTVLKYGNMIRVRDCPCDSLRNRMGVLDLRLTSGKTAVHSDPIMWNRNAPAEVAARHLISALFGVPQVSVILKDMPKPHLEAVRFWLDFYRRNLDILHSEDLEVKNPETYYSQAKSRKNGSVIGVNYANVPFEIGRFANDRATYTLINSSDETALCVRVTEDMGVCKIRICDCLGNPVSEMVSEWSAGVVPLHIPVCGFAEISKP